MPSVVIYTAAMCPYCHMAKQLLTDKRVVFEDIDVTNRRELRAQMTALAGGVSTVPQIWIGERHVGGCDDLYALEQAGDLDPLLQPLAGLAPEPQP